MMQEIGSLVQKIAALQDYTTYADLNWEGTFEDYLQHRAREPAR